GKGYGTKKDLERTEDNGFLAGAKAGDVSEIELLETTDPDGPIGRYLEKRGEGIHHIALRVENIEEALKELKEKGVRLVDEKPRKGAGGAKIAFLHPKATNGVLVELCERG
ncbi:methylmalonyl-CoA epimerase, partial [Candidatus Parcubacteria bacterium]|nr:methylmalonyl-CoA epimerase [Candidatus Parcubacteria bacterium]